MCVCVGGGGGGGGGGTFLSTGRHGWNIPSAKEGLMSLFFSFQQNDDSLRKLELL